MPQQLSAKEQSLFRTVVRNYEDKQYKKGTAALVLFPGRC
jgi:peptide alpha-N-acetyltransferase